MQGRYAHRAAARNAPVKAYCYFEAIADRQFDEHSRMVELWRANWSSRGWETVVLGPAEAEAHPAYAWCVNAASKLNAINHRDYQRACFTRWLALAHALGRDDLGLFTDYDVYNVSFTPNDAALLYSPAQPINLHYNTCSQPIILDGRQATAIPWLLMVVTQFLVNNWPAQIDWTDMSFWEADQKLALGFARHEAVCFPFHQQECGNGRLIHLSYESSGNVGKLNAWQRLAEVYP